jgi:hypothetical protein
MSVAWQACGAVGYFMRVPARRCIWHGACYWFAR